MNKILILLLCAAVVVGCEPTPDEKVLFDEFVVSTNYSADTDFGSYSTYAMSDTIGLISNYDNDTIVKDFNYARPVIEAIAANLDSRGYARVKANENPDLGVNVLLVHDLSVFQDVWYPNYYGYPGYYYPAYYGYGSYYYGYPYVSTYAYNTAVLVVEIVDLKNVTNNRVEVIWNAHMGDVISSIDRLQQSLQAIDEAFDQSPFVRRIAE